ncbi:hypothetical protein NEOLEDRAFT_815972 [Neolentinus lepideus HHB14362 ss-1]|uniref:Uncharacterized protein n=1 Tax=Neolentinus lepideus HHB14362 ss-1 TaxID=1314782 RepID=A0A165PCQ4_9AGAM|nr:hypothetical protein NEOLEDRAFT_815972 [Neolentinus lepideus HHB14362 ss-1]
MLLVIQVLCISLLGLVYWYNSCLRVLHTLTFFGTVQSTIIAFDTGTRETVAMKASNSNQTQLQDILPERMAGHKVYKVIQALPEK